MVQSLFWVAEKELAKMSKPCDRLPVEAIQVFVKNDEQGTQQQCMDMALLCFRYRAMLHPFELCGMQRKHLSVMQNFLCLCLGKRKNWACNMPAIFIKVSVAFAKHVPTDNDSVVDCCVGAWTWMAIGAGGLHLHNSARQAVTNRLCQPVGETSGYATWCGARSLFGPLAAHWRSYNGNAWRSFTVGSNGNWRLGLWRQYFSICTQLYQ